MDNLNENNQQKYIIIVYILGILIKICLIGFGVPESNLHIFPIWKENYCIMLYISVMYTHPLHIVHHCSSACSIATVLVYSQAPTIDESTRLTSFLYYYASRHLHRQYPWHITGSVHGKRIKFWRTKVFGTCVLYRYISDCTIHAMALLSAHDIAHNHR